MDNIDDTIVKNYSIGILQKLGLIQAFMEKSTILLLDEPFSGLDKETRARAWSFLKQYQRENKACVLISSHHDDDLEAICEHLLKIEERKITKLK